MYGYIYRTTNNLNGVKYIGQHSSSEFDPNYKGSGKLLWRAINKYGWDNFSVEMLCPCFSQEELNAEEILLIAYFDAVESSDYYNLQAGGQSDNLKGSRLSDETKLKMSISHKGQLAGQRNPMYGRKRSPDSIRKLADLNRVLFLGSGNPMYGTHLSEEAKKHLSIRNSGAGNPFYGRKHSAESKFRMTQSKLGSNNPGSGKVWITKGTQNKRVLPSELDVYISEGWKKGRYVTDETRRKCSERNRRRFHPELFS